MPNRRIVVLTCAVSWVCAWAAAAQTLAPQDYPQWRGQQRDGAASAFSLPSSWPDTLTLEWKVQLGQGYATPLIIRDRVFAFTRDAGGREVMTALDARSGRQIWQTGYPAPYTANSATRPHGEGPKSTPLFHDGRLYSLGITNILSAFDASSGKLLWQKPAPAIQPTYSTAMSPIADGNRVFFHVGGDREGVLAALDAATGDERWRYASDGAAFGSPIIAEFAGTRTLVTLTAQRLVGLDLGTGRLLWERPFKVAYDTNATTPIVYNGTIIVSGHDAGTMALRPVRQGREGWTLETLWTTPAVEMKLSNGVIIGDTLVGMSHKNSGQMFALDPATGKVLWTGNPREATNSALVKAGDLLVMLHDDGRLIVARPSRTGLDRLRTYTVADSATWAQPTLSGNGIFVKDVSTLARWTPR
jgi:outer membrane protein assembly factor BamB